MTGAGAGCRDRRHTGAWSRIELPTNIREVSQCLEKAPTRALSLLKLPNSAFIIKNVLRHHAKWVPKPKHGK